jgi:hypothetical protein
VRNSRLRKDQREARPQDSLEQSLGEEKLDHMQQLGLVISKLVFLEECLKQRSGAEWPGLTEMPGSVK